MTSLLRHGAALFSLFTLSVCACAQTMSISEPGYTSTKLFDATPGYTISGMAADALGNVYYIENDSNFVGRTKLYKRSPLDNYAARTELFDLGSGEIATTGSFVVVTGSKLYFGEKNSGNIYSINTDGSNVDPLGTLAANYDAAFVDGHLFVSYDAGSLNNRVSRFELVSDGAGGFQLGTANVIVNADGGYNGAFEYAGGDLYYGAGDGSVRGLYEFTAAEVTGAFGPTELTLDGDHEFGATTTERVSALALGSGVDLWKTDPFSPGLLRFDRTNGGVSTIANATGNSTFTQLDFAANSLFVNVTDLGSTFHSAVFKVAVPEPSSALALLAGTLVFARRRR